MKVLVCMDSWKGSLDAREACAAVAAGLREGWPDAEIRGLPLADGGEGTLDLVQAARPGERHWQEVCGPLPCLRANAPFLFWPGKGEALVEVATCAGLTLLTAAQRDPLRTSTRGVGELIAAALARGARKISLAVGGSATVDAGAGMAMALGWRFLDRQGHAIPCGGEGLLRLDHILPPVEAGPPFRMDVLCDVTNPLLGPLGAASVFGPQKGANPRQVAVLDAALSRFAAIVGRDVGIAVGDVPGGGAAGGIPAAALALFEGKLTPGIDRLLDLVGFAAHARDADWVIVGEGHADSQSLRGKVLSGVLRATQGGRARVGVVAGGIDLAPEEARGAGIHRMVSARPPDMPLAMALRQAAPLARQAGKAFADLGETPCGAA